MIVLLIIIIIINTNSSMTEPGGRNSHTCKLRLHERGSAFRPRKRPVGRFRERLAPILLNMKSEWIVKYQWLPVTNY